LLLQTVSSFNGWPIISDGIHALQHITWSDLLVYMWQDRQKPPPTPRSHTCPCNRNDMGCAIWNRWFTLRRGFKGEPAAAISFNQDCLAMRCKRTRPGEWHTYHLVRRDNEKREGKFTKCKGGTRMSPATHHI
jgi:hypothetical protein